MGDWQHGLDHGGFRSDGDGEANGPLMESVVVQDEPIVEIQILEEDANMETTRDPDWQHGLDHGGFKSDGDGEANNGPLSIENQVLQQYANRETTHDADWQHGLDHGGFKSDGDGEANNGPLSVENQVLQQYANRETTPVADWQHGPDHGGF